METATSLLSGVLMKRFIIVFQQPSTAARSIVRALEAGGFSVLSARSVEAMHTLFTEQQVFAAVVHRSVAREYHIRVQPHLAEAKSSIAIICWEEREDGCIATKIFSARESCSDHTRHRENRLLAAKAALLVRSTGTIRKALAQEAQEGAGSYRESIQLPDIPGMHRKMRTILDTIAASGNSGASPEYIIRTIWPEPGKNRIRDLQSYICKMRKILELDNRLPLRITYSNRRYRLTMHG